MGTRLKTFIQCSVKTNSTLTLAALRPGLGSVESSSRRSCPANLYFTLRLSQFTKSERDRALIRTTALKVTAALADKMCVLMNNLQRRRSAEPGATQRSRAAEQEALARRLSLRSDVKRCHLLIEMYFSVLAGFLLSWRCGLISGLCRVMHILSNLNFFSF